MSQNTSSDCKQLINEIDLDRELSVLLSSGAAEAKKSGSAVFGHRKKRMTQSVKEKKCELCKWMLKSKHKV